MYSLTLPIYYVQEFKTKPPKTWLLGLNAYRNWNPYLSNKIKQDYTELVTNQLPEVIEPVNTFTMDYKLYYKNKICDGSNIIALVEKMTLDALEKAGVIPNDNVQYHLGSTWSVIEQSRDNPRCEITISHTS